MNWGQFLLALIIATIVYRWQKTIDRETAIQSEKRVVYAKYISASKQFYLSQPYKGTAYTAEEVKEFFSLSGREREVYALRDQVVLLASNQVMAAVLDHDRKFRDWMINFPEPGVDDQATIREARRASDHYQASYDRLIKVMRAELQEHQSMKVHPLIARTVLEAKRLKARLRRP